MKSKCAIFLFVLVAAHFTLIRAQTQRSDPLSPGEHSVEVNGIRFWYRVAGRGPVLVVQAPGWGIGSEYLQIGLNPLAEHYTLVFYDPRGNGRSTRPSDAQHMASSDMAEDLEQLRLRWGLESFDLLGHSNGGLISLLYASRYPAHLKRLVLVDSGMPGFYDPAVSQNIDRRRGDPRFASAIAAWDNKSKMPANDEEFAAHLKGILPLFFSDPARADELQMGKSLPSLWARGNNEAADQASAAESGKGLHVASPTLIIVGSDDFIVGPSTAEQIAKVAPKSKLKILPNAGHFPWVESPSFFSEVESFLR